MPPEPLAPNASPRHLLYAACEAGRVEEARRYIEEDGVDINTAMTTERQSFRIALHAAAANGHLECTEAVRQSWLERRYLLDARRGTVSSAFE